MKLGCALLALVTLLGCAGAASAPRRWDFFAAMPDDDEFGPVVLVWQGSRLLEQERGTGFDPKASGLAEQYVEFSDALRREIVERTMKWVQTSSGLYWSEDGKVDYWPTLPEVLEQGGDDCDGMDVLTFETLRAVGFGRGEIYRAVLVHNQTKLHHMVTLWFARDRPQDPWVVDPTGDVTALLRRLSEVAGSWTPLLLFDETDRFRVQAASSG